MTSETANTRPDTPALDRAYLDLAGGFATAADALAPADWDRPSPCEGWTARDVVAHVIDTQRDFLAGHGVALADRPSLDDPAAAWRTHSADVGAALADPAVAGRAFDGHFGPTTVGDTLLRFYGFDMIAHRWDVTAATGRAHTFTDDELDAMATAADGFGDALYGEGVCVRIDIPAGADRQTRLLARLGRGPIG